MAKLRGPLMSISATGSIASLLTYRATRTGSVVQRPPIPRAPPTFPQTSERARCAATAANWRTLDAAARAPWDALATARGSSPWITFFTESTIQQIVPPDLPLLPAE